MIEQRLHVLPGLPGDETDRTVCHRRESLVHIPHPSLGRHLAGQQVPFVNNENTRFVLVRDVVSELLIHLAHLLLGIEKHQHDICAPNATLCPVHSVPIDVRLDAFVSSQARCVHRHEFMTVQVEHHIDAISRRARHLTDNHTFGLNQRIHKRALADVSFSDDRQFHHRRFDFGGHRIQLRNALHDQIEQFIFVSILVHAHAQQPTSAKLMKLIGVCI